MSYRVRLWNQVSIRARPDVGVNLSANTLQRLTHNGHAATSCNPSRAVRFVPADIRSEGWSFARARDVRRPLPYAIHCQVALRGVLADHHDAASAQARADRNSAAHARRTFPDELREMPTRG